MIKRFLILSLIIAISCYFYYEYFYKHKIIVKDDELSEIIDDVFKQFNKTNKVYFEIYKNNTKLGNIVLELNETVCPITVGKFIHEIKKNSYKNSKFHRIIKDFCIQGGDIVTYNGQTNVTSNNEQFCDENFILKHNEPFVVSMANNGPDTNGSQFFITTSVCNHLDNKHVVFGKVIDDNSKQIIMQMNDAVTNDRDEPIDEYVINNCGYK